MPGTEKLTDDQIRVAVEWWATAIQDPLYDNGDGSLTGVMTKALAQMACDSHPITAESVDKFRTSLTNLLETTNPLFLTTDYGPCQDLAICAAVAGVHPARFPWKTCMWLKDGRVIVRAGYGAPEETLWPIVSTRSD